ncbi:MAG: ABC transporter permease [Clostridia bacterium]|nr:ABC transporter permease [Clostridia bacterium]
MKFLNFFLLYGKRTVRDKMFFLIMLLFPFLLIWVLGSAFSGIMGGGETDSDPVVNANLIYTVSRESQLSELFEEHMTVDNDFFTMTEFNDIETGREKIKYNEYDAFVVLTENKITIYKNSAYNFNSSMGELIIKAFADDYNLMYEIAVTDPAALANANDAGNGSFTEEVSFDRQRTPGSMDYYGVTMATMFIFYGVIFLGTYFAGNRLNKSEDRIKASPASIVSYQWGSALGNIVLMMLQALFVIGAGLLVFNVYWGGAMGIGFIVIFAEAIMISALGTILGLTMKNENAIAGISQIVIPAIVFLGDGYTPIGGGPVLQTIKKISPMYWINHGIFDAIYLGEYEKAFIAVIICTGIATACTLVVVMMNSGRNRRMAHA